MFDARVSLGVAAHCCVAVVAILSAVPATAQEREDPALILAGPRVHQDRIPGQYDSLVAIDRPGQFGGARAIQPQVFYRAVAALEDPSTPPALRLSEQQRRQLRRLKNDYAAAVRTYMNEHRDEIALLRRQLGQKDGRQAENDLGQSRGRPAPPPRLRLESAPEPDDSMDAAGDAMEQGTPPDAMSPGEAGGMNVIDPSRRLREIRRGAPRFADWQTKSWKLLSPEQQAIVTKALQRHESEMAKRRAEQFAKRAIKEQQKRQADRPVPKQMPDRLGRILRRLTPQQRERILNLPPQRRRAAVERLIESRGRRGRDAPARRLDKPAPTVKDVHVPAPEASDDHRG